MRVETEIFPQRSGINSGNEVVFESRVEVRLVFHRFSKHASDLTRETIHDRSDFL